MISDDSFVTAKNLIDQELLLLTLQGFSLISEGLRL